MKPTAENQNSSKEEQVNSFRECFQYCSSLIIAHTPTAIDSEDSGTFLCFEY